VLWWVRVVAPNYDFNLRLDLFGDCSILTNDMHGAASLPVETHSLGKRLGHHQFKALIYKVAEALTVFGQIATDKALISCIEEWVKPTSFANCCDLLPLVHRWIDTCWVVSTGMEHHDGARNRISQIFHHAVEVESLSSFVEISILSCC